MLLEQSRDFLFDPRTNIVETHISRLRPEDRSRTSRVVDPDGARRRLLPACPELRLFRTTSFRLAAIYLALFVLSTGSFARSSTSRCGAKFDRLRRQILEETAALRRTFAEQGRDRLSAILAARGSIGGASPMDFESPALKRLAGDLVAFGLLGGWAELKEDEDDEPPEGRPRDASGRLSLGCRTVRP